MTSDQREPRRKMSKTSDLRSPSDSRSRKKVSKTLEPIAAFGLLLEKPLTLREKQSLFAKMVAKLLVKIYAEGYEVTLGEAWRPSEMALIYAKRGTGIKNSLHTKKLAIDLNLFLNGKYLRKTEDHRLFGLWWEEQHPLARWGGAFGDGNHYSLTHGGVK